MASTLTSLASSSTTSLLSTAARHKTLGEELWKRTPKINGELFALTYGAMVVQLVRDYEDYSEVNVQLEKMWVLYLSLDACDDVEDRSFVILTYMGWTRKQGI